jgi:hypothetical protein
LFHRIDGWTHLNGHVAAVGRPGRGTSSQRLGVGMDAALGGGIPRKEHLMSTTTLIVLVVLAVVLFGGGGGYYWTRRR